MKKHINSIFVLFMVVALIPETARSQDWARFDRAGAYGRPNNELLPKPMGIGAGMDNVDWWGHDPCDWLNAEPTLPTTPFNEVVFRGQSPEGGAGGSGTGAGAATDPTVPLTQLQLQNTFIPESFNSTGYSNLFIVQPVLPFTINEHAFFPYHIIRPTIPVIAPTPDPDGPAGVQGGLGDTTILDAFIHPMPELKLSWGVGYAAILPTATHEALGAREWQLGPAAFFTTKAVDKWLFGVLCYPTFSLESDAYQVLAQPIAVRYLPNEWYVGWGDLLWKVDDQNGDYNLPLALRVGKVTEIGKHKLNVFIEPYCTPSGLHRTAGRSDGTSWGIKLNVTFLLPDAKLHAPILSRLYGGECGCR